MRPAWPSHVALGFRVHSGWAALVAVAGSVREPEVLLRRRIEFADFEDRATVQPYHAAVEMSLAKAERFLARVADESRELAQRSIRQAIEELKPRQVVCAAMTLGSGRALGSLEATLNSHPAIHTAEGQFFRDVVRAACEDCGLECRGFREKEIATQVGPLADLGKLLGPPWQQDQKLASLVALLGLSDTKVLA